MRNFKTIRWLMTQIAEIFAPLIPALILGGLVLGLTNIMGELQFYEAKTLIEISPFWQAISDVLNLIVEAIFYLFPIGMIWSISKKLGTDQGLGLFFGFTVIFLQGITTQAGYIQVIPAMLAGFTLSYLQKFFQKVLSKSLVIGLFLTLILAWILSYFIWFPIGNWLGTQMANTIYSSLTSKVSWLWAGIFGLSYSGLSMTGLHHVTNIVDLQLMSEYGGTNVWPMIALANIAQGSSALAFVCMKVKNKKLKMTMIPAVVSAYLGVTEPALFGINLKYKYPFIAAIIASSIAAIVSNRFSVMANSIGVGGIPGILSIQFYDIPLFIFAIIVASSISFTLTCILGWKYGETCENVH